MTRAIEHIKGLPDQSATKGLTLRKFLVAVLNALTFAPDREFSASFKRLQKEFSKYFGSAAKVEEALEKHFFTHLYVDRIERQEIEGMIPTMRLVLVHGLVGCGKTVVLKKIGLNLEDSKIFKMIYFDFKAITETFDSVKEENFPDRFRQFIFDRVSKQYIEGSSETVIKKWYTYKIRFDEQEEYANLRRWIIQDYVRRPLPTDLDWETILEEGPVRDRYNSLRLTPQLRTLLLFLKESFPFVLCFDNIDRHLLRLQRQILSLSLDLSNDVQIPIILAIREPNLRRLITEGAFGDTVLLNFLERVTAGEEKSFPIQKMPDASIKTLLEQRLKFIQENEGFRTLTDFFEEMKKEHTVDFPEFQKRFWDVFTRISSTFVDEGIYHYCNYNIREILILYFKFITKLLLNPEQEYSIDKLLPQELKVRLTKLRNYFYKWLICPGTLIPKPETGLINIYRHCAPNLRMLDLRILEFVLNWERINAGENIAFGEMARTFSRFGIKEEVLREHISHLTKNQNLYELGSLWLDKKERTPINDATVIQLLPAGHFFLGTLSTSREYAFWNALTADLQKDVVGRSFTFSETYNDRFKLDLVHKFIQDILLPAMQTEKDYFDQNLQTPKEWEGSALEYFKRSFSIDGRSYAERLLISIMRTIPHAGLAPHQRREYEKKFAQLRKMATSLTASAKESSNPASETV